MLRDRSLIPLSHQHHNGLALCVLTERSLAADASEPNLRAMAERIVARYEIEMKNHFELEEAVLFPAFEQYGGARETVARLVAEHREIEALVETLRQQPTAEAVYQFTGILRRHIRTEENDFFEEAQKRIPRNALDELGREFESRAVRVCL